MLLCVSLLEKVATRVDAFNVQQRRHFRLTLTSARSFSRGAPSTWSSAAGVCPPDRSMLTDREIEVLRGISMGLTSRELGERMNISPNTVKAFLHVMMIKMGVKTRGAIAANILNRSRAVESAPAESD